MSRPLVLIAVFGFVLSFDGSPVDSLNFGGSKKMNALQIIKSYGYPAEGHTIKTEDGYLLELHRIPYGIKAKPSLKRSPILISHCIGCSSDLYLLQEPNKSLAFTLADLGFDVWLANLRGNTYSRQHVTLSPSQNSFWNFSWHESGIYDLPAIIDFILKHTNHERLIYIGYSMGGTSFFVLMSTRSEYNEKIETALLMGPVSHINNTKSSLIKSASSLINEYEFLSNVFTHGEAFPTAPVLRESIKLLCTIAIKLCFSIMYEIAGGTSKPYKREVLEKFLNYFPAGNSMKAMRHYYQNMRAGVFRPFDYGPDNVAIYGAPHPPEYKLEKVKVPVTIYFAKNDFFCSKPEVEYLARRLPNLKSTFMIDSNSFSHLDFVMGKSVEKAVYDRMLRDLFSHLGEKFAASGRGVRWKTATGKQVSLSSTGTT